jgi:hypothetical protein
VSGVRADAVALGGLALWTALLALLMWGTWGNMTMDTGYDLVAAARTSEGELPYIDYVYWYGPVSPLALGSLYAIVGTGVWPAVALGLTLSVLAIGLTYRLARYFVAAPAAAVAAALVAPAALSSANNSYVLPHSTSAPLSIVLVLGVLLALIRYERVTRATRRTLVLAGVLAALVALTRPEMAISLYLAGGAWLIYRVWAARENRRKAVRDALAVIAPALAIPGIVYGGLAAAVGLHDLLFVNLYPRDFVQAAGHVILESHAPRTPGSVAKLLVYTAVYGAGLVALFVLARIVAAGGRNRTLALVAAGGCAVAFLGVLAVRPETVRYYLEFAYSWIPAGAWIAVAVLAVRGRRSGGGTPTERWALLVALMLAVVATTTYASFKPFPNALYPEATPYVLPIVAVFLVWLHTLVTRRARVLGVAWLALLVVGSAGLALHDARAETARVSGPGGSMAAAPADAVALQGAVEVLERFSRPGDPVLIAPQLSSLYVLADRENPLPQLSLLPGALPTPADEEAAIRRMANVRLVLLDRRPLTLYRHGAFGTTFDRRLAGWVRSDFRRVATVATPGQDALVVDTWLRRSP